MKLSGSDPLVLLAEKLLIDDEPGWLERTDGSWIHDSSGLFINLFPPTELQKIPLGFFAKRCLRAAMQTCIYKRALRKAVEEQERCLKQMEPIPLTETKPKKTATPRASSRRSKE